MIARIFRLIDRFGRLTIKGGIWAGDRVANWANALAYSFTGRAQTIDATPETAHTEGRVRLLSSLIVVLLAGFVILVLWATNVQSHGNPVIRLIGGTDQPGLAGAPTPDTSQGGIPLQGTTGTIVFSMWAGAQKDIFALSAGQSSPTRLTDSPEDDREPVWSPDGQRIAFASRRDGNWELYTLTLATGEVKRLTYDLVFEGGPSWSPDSLWLAYEGYHEGNLDIYIIKSDGSEDPSPITADDPAPDFDPAWISTSPGRSIAYVSSKSGSQDIYVRSLDDLRNEVDVTNTPNIDESEPAWSPDGKSLAYCASEDGVSLIYVVDTSAPNAEPHIVGQGHSPSWSPDGLSIAYIVDRSDGSLLLTGQPGAWDTSNHAFALPAIARDVNWSAAVLPQPLPGSLAFAAVAPISAAYTENASPTEGHYRLMSLPGVIAESEYLLSDQVDDSFMALKDYVNRAAGWDFLGRLDQVFWRMNQVASPGQSYRNWHKTGRAFDIIQGYNQGNPPQIEVVQEQTEAETYWRIYVRCAVQDGTLGEPLRALPWDFNARTSGDVAAYDSGGRVKGSVPSGYYIDFTGIAQVFGWRPAPSDPTWRDNWPGILYWQYEKRDNLDWWSAMLELYPESDIRQVFEAPTAGPAASATPEPPTEAGSETPSTEPEVTVPPTRTPSSTPN
jgi:TolB protein